MARPNRTTLGVAALSAAAMGTCIWGLLSAGVIGTPNVGAIGFEFVIAISAVVGLFYGLGRLGPDGGLTPALIAMSLVVAGGLAFVSLGKSPSATVTQPLFLLRFGLAGLLVASSVVLALGERRECWTMLSRGAALLAGAGLLGAGAWKLQQATAGEVRAVHLAGLIGAILLAIVVCAMACVGAHLIVRAFERAIELREDSAAGAKPGGSGSEQGVRNAAG
ncbi:MAG: hypothetical protein H6811_10655 [Phycisphaeraceae bacterium]|nr:hypothetical protein [Phycisphaeraceae bacterium]